MVKALTRAFRWRKLLETGVFATVEEIATAEKINASYVGRVLRLTLLAPDIVEAILDGRQPSAMTLAVLMRPFAVGWQGPASNVRIVASGPKSGREGNRGRLFSASTDLEYCSPATVLERAAAGNPLG
jgi:hypothetical protein